MEFPPAVPRPPPPYGSDVRVIASELAALLIVFWRHARTVYIYTCQNLGMHDAFWGQQAVSV
jgi:hypothetical protein